MVTSLKLGRLVNQLLCCLPGVVSQLLVWTRGIPGKWDGARALLSPTRRTWLHWPMFWVTAPYLLPGSHPRSRLPLPVGFPLTAKRGLEPRASQLGSN